MLGGGGGHASADLAQLVAQELDLLLQRAVLLEQVVDDVVAVLRAARLELLQLALELLDVLLGARPDGALRLAVIGAFPGQLRGREGRDAAGA